MVNIGYGNDKRTRHVLPNGAVCIQRQGVGDSTHALGLENLYSYVSPLYSKLFSRARELSAKKQRYPSHTQCLRLSNFPGVHLCVQTGHPW